MDSPEQTGPSTKFVAAIVLVSLALFAWVAYLSSPLEGVGLASAFATGGIAGGIVANPNRGRLWVVIAVALVLVPLPLMASSPRAYLASALGRAVLACSVSWKDLQRARRLAANRAIPPELPDLRA